MKHYFIVNPVAGKGSKDALCDKIRNIGIQKEVDFEIYMTAGERDATRFVSEICDAMPDEQLRFYACGGDGTFGEVVSGAAGRENAAVGLIPAGTGNDFARNFNSAELFFDPEAQLEGNTMEIDLLRCNEYYAVNMINIGFDCEVVRKTVSIKKSPLIPKKLAYIAGLVMTLVRKPGVKTCMSVDGGEETDCHYLLTTFANGCFCGGGFYSNPYASLQDGRIDSILVKNISRARFLTLVSSYKKGIHIVPKNEKILSHCKFKTVHMRFEKPQGVCVDGELAEMQELTITCVPNALRLILPCGVSPTAVRA